MSTDFENELRDLFREKAEDAPLATPTLPASAPQQLLRRSRRHQVGTVLGSMVVVLALIVGSVAGLTRILGEGGDDRDIGDTGYEVFERTATVEAFTISSPSDWYLVNQWPWSMLIAVEGGGGSSSACVAVPGNVVQECDDNPTGATTSSPIPVPHGLPMLQLSNVDLGLITNACEDGIPGDGAALYVALDYDASIAGTVDPTIQEFPPGEPGLPPTIAEGPCGPGRYAHFTVNGEPFFSWIGVGSGASDEDREIVEASYEMMSAIPDWEPQPPDETTPAYVIAGGASDNGDPWRLELRPGERGAELFLEGVEPRHSVDMPDQAVPIGFCCATTDGLSDATLLDVTFGFVRKDASGVELQVRRDDELTGQVLPGTLVPVPPSLGSFDFDVFFIPGTAGLAGQVVPVGTDGSVEPPPVAEPRNEFVELSGAFGGKPWTVRFVGGFAEGTACMKARIVDADGELCPRPIATSLAGNQPSLHGWNTDALYLLAGSVPLEVVEMRLIEDDGTVVPSQSRCAMGPTGWTDPDRKVCAIALPTEGSGTLLYFDADGGVIFEEGIGWGWAEPEAPVPTPVDPVHGGTYWAVYPWLGAPGDPEADDVSAHLLSGFGIEAFPGDLACDQGAAEALGTDAEQGIGVYFETDDEANAFALQAGLLDHTGRVIARVTTYCLD
jgi:hypothetical protein